jgi:aspartate aminotransferase
MPSSCNPAYYELGAQGSAIRELFAYGQARKAQIGADKVFDFSLGNPSVPAPAQVKDAIIEALEEPSLELHGYTPAQGLVSTRTAIAAKLNRDHGTAYTAADLYLTMGAAAALDASINAVCEPGDEVIVIAPFFPEYRMWIENARCTCVLSPADPATMFPVAADVAARITERTRAVIVNSPNNPTGAVYPAEVLAELAEVLRAASQKNGRTVYLIADEPYREIAYAGVEVPWIPSIYADTLVCYSYSKSLSLPGERIGYVLVPPTTPAHKEVYAAVCGAGRALGYVCAPSLIQKVAEKCCDLPSDVAAYAENRDLLYGSLTAMGYECVEPRGAFYLWVRALEPDAKAFSLRARDNHELLLVPSDDFGMGGWVRISYCVAKEVIEGSLPAFRALYDEYQA